MCGQEDSRALVEADISLCVQMALMYETAWESLGDESPGGQNPITDLPLPLARFIQSIVITSPS